MGITRLLRTVLRGYDLQKVAQDTGLEYHVLADFTSGQQALRLDQADHLLDHLRITCQEQERSWNLNHPVTEAQKLVSEYLEVAERLSQDPPNVDEWRRRFRSFDLPVLWYIGKRMPEECEVVFRGLSGSDASRRKSGLSWSLSPCVAAWFATKENHPEPALFMAFVEPKDVFCILWGEEREVICDPPIVHPLALSPQEIQQLAGLYTSDSEEEPPE